MAEERTLVVIATRGFNGTSVCPLTGWLKQNPDGTAALAKYNVLNFDGEIGRFKPDVLQRTAPAGMITLVRVVCNGPPSLAGTWWTLTSENPADGIPINVIREVPSPLSPNPSLALPKELLPTDDLAAVFPPNPVGGGTTLVITLFDVSQDEYASWIRTRVLAEAANPTFTQDTVSISGSTTIPVPTARRNTYLWTGLATDIVLAPLASLVEFDQDIEFINISGTTATLRASLTNDINGILNPLDFVLLPTGQGILLRKSGPTSYAAIQGAVT